MSRKRKARKHSHHRITHQHAEALSVMEDPGESPADVLRRVTSNVAESMKATLNRHNIECDQSSLQELARISLTEKRHRTEKGHRHVAPRFPNPTALNRGPH